MYQVVKSCIQSVLHIINEHILRKVTFVKPHSIKSASRFHQRIRKFTLSSCQYPVESSISKGTRPLQLSLSASVVRMRNVAYREWHAPRMRQPGRFISRNRHFTPDIYQSLARIEAAERTLIASLSRARPTYVTPSN